MLKGSFPQCASHEGNQATLLLVPASFASDGCDGNEAQESNHQPTSDEGTESLTDHRAAFLLRKFGIFGDGRGGILQMETVDPVCIRAMTVSRSLPSELRSEISR